MAAIVYAECRTCAYGVQPPYWQADEVQVEAIKSKTQLCPKCKARNCHLCDFEGAASRARSEGEKDEVITQLKAHVAELERRLAAAGGLEDQETAGEPVAAAAAGPTRGRRRE